LQEKEVNKTGKMLESADKYKRLKESAKIKL
jgi:hypothetical protein